jgi:hypothetical protein
VKHLIPIAVSTLLLTVPQGAAEQAPEATYDALVARVRAGDVDIDYSALRRAFVDTEHYNPFGSGSANQQEKMRSALESEKYSKALKVAEAVLTDAFVNGEAHAVAAMCHDKLGRADRSRYHRAIAQGQFDSICSGKDGRSPDTACHVISTDEEYFYMSLASLQFVSQALTECKSGPCDAMEVKDPKSGETFTLYFDVSTQMRAIENSLGGE